MYTLKSLSALSLLSLFSVISAQSSTVSLFIPILDPQPLVASIKGHDSSATTYQISCPPSPSQSDRECGILGEMIYTGGPKTAAWSTTETGFTASFQCDLSGKTKAVCTESMDGKKANFPGSTTETYTGASMMFLPVTVTSSGGEVSADPTGAATAAAGKSVVTTATVTSTGIAVETVTGKNSGEVSTSGSERKTESSTAGLAMIIGNTGVVGGVAVAVVAAVL